MRQCYAPDVAESSQFTEQLGCEACFCEPRCVPKRRKTRRYERKPREKGAERGVGRRNEMENGGRQGYQCGRWLLAAKWLQAANALTTSYNIEYKRNQKYRAESPKVSSRTDPRPDTNSVHFFTYTLITYYLNSNVVYSILVSTCRQKFRIAYILIDVAIFIESLIVRFHTGTWIH